MKPCSLCDMDKVNCRNCPFDNNNKNSYVLMNRWNDSEGQFFSEIIGVYDNFKDALQELREQAQVEINENFYEETDRAIEEEIRENGAWWKVSRLLDDIYYEMEIVEK